MGQTQGITRAPRPPSAEKIRNGTRPRSACRATSLTTSPDFDSPAAASGSAAVGSGGGTAAMAEDSTSDALASPGRTVSVASGRVQRPGNLQVLASQI